MAVEKESYIYAIMPFDQRVDNLYQEVIVHAAKRAGFQMKRGKSMQAQGIIETTKKLIEEVWEKAKEMRSKDPDIQRKDKYDNKIRFGSYGTQGDYGWEIDHKNPKDKGGSDQLKNLQPLHWEENREKGTKIRHKGK